MDKLFENVDCIIPMNTTCGMLWLGNYKSALDPEFLKKNKISVIINCSVDLPFIYDILDIDLKLDTFRIPVYDSLLEHDIKIMEEYFHIILPFILQKLIIEHENVLVHCHQGIQRSAIIVSALLFILVDSDTMLFRDKSNKTIVNIQNKSKLMRNIIKYIVEKRPKAFNYGYKVNFKKSIEQFFNIMLDN